VRPFPLRKELTGNDWKQTNYVPNFCFVFNHGVERDAHKSDRLIALKLGLAQEKVVGKELL
jgi:hypothetical protein